MGTGRHSDREYLRVGVRGILVGRTRVGMADIGAPLGNRQERGKPW